MLPLRDLLIEGSRNGVYKPKEFHGHGVKIVNMGELFEYPRLSSNVPMKRLELKASELKRFELASGDLLFARRSLVAEGAGKCCIVLNVSEPTVFESSIIRVKPNPLLVDSVFLFYTFESSIGRYILGTILRQTAVAGITGMDLVKLTVPLPPLPEQRRIAAILGALDDKIELNRKMNRTLEEMAQAIFKAWFVEFEGQADLVQSDVGLIPRGWKVGGIDRVASCVRETVDPSDVPTDTPYVGLEHVPRRCVALDAWGQATDANSAKTKFVAGDILFGKLRPYFHKVVPVFMKGVSSTDILVIRPQADWRWFAFGHLYSDAMVAHATAAADGTKMPRANWKDLCRLGIVLPPAKQAIEYNSVVVPMFERIAGNIHESRTLATLRDTLLPRLISGELRVPEAEDLVASVR